MELLESIYNDVIRKLHFSVTGHSGFEDELYDFYNRFAESAIFKQNHDIRFFIGSVCKLQDPFEWKVAPYDTLFFKAYFDVHKETALSFYFFILQKLGNDLLKDKNINASLLIAESFSKHVNLRVSLVDYLNPFCKNDDRISVFDIKIPEKIFNAKIREQIPEFRDFVFKGLKPNDGIENKIIRQDKGKRNRLYKKHDVTDLTQYEKLYKEIFDEKETKRVYNSLVETLKNRYHYLTVSDDEIHYKKMAVAAIGISFVCLYFNVSLEYFTGIAKVKISGKYKTDYRNLGGIVVGYPRKKPISRTERTLLNLVADKITSVIAGQILSKSIEKDSQIGKSFGFIKKFNTDYNQLFHDAGNNEEKKLLIDKAFSDLKNNGFKELLSEKTYSEIENYLNDIPTDIIKISDFIKQKSKSNKDNLKTTIEELIIRLNINAGADKSKFNATAISNGKHKFVLHSDIQWLVEILNQSIQNSLEHGKAKNITLSLNCYKADGTESTTCSGSQYIEFVLVDNGKGCDLSQVDDSSSFIGKLSSEEYNSVINGLGSITMISGSAELIYNPKKEIKTLTTKSKGFTLKIKIVL